MIEVIGQDSVNALNKLFVFDLTRRCLESSRLESPEWSRKVPKPIEEGALCKMIARKTTRPKVDYFDKL